MGSSHKDPPNKLERKKGSNKKLNGKKIIPQNKKALNWGNLKMPKKFGN